MRTFHSPIRLLNRILAARAAAQDGFSLIEVIVSALMLALVVVGTFSGFAASDDASTQQRLHDEASVLAAESQEQLRSDPASALEKLAAAPHTYSQTADGVQFTIAQEARFVGGPEGGAGCSVTEHKSQITNALRITSTVSWVHTNTTAQPVTETSVVTPPTGSALEVDVGNAPAPTAGVSGVNVIVKYTAAGSTAVSTLEGTTGSAGCLVFGAIPSTAAEVEIPEQTGFVTINGSQYIAPVEVTIAPNTVTYHQVTYNRGGAITAEFTYEKSTRYKYTNNEGATEETTVTGDTFVAASAGMKLEPDYEVGSTRGELSGGLYEPIPGAPGFYKVQSTSPEAPKYPAGNLFPFPETEGEGAWRAYAGDCAANDPETLKVPEVTLERKWTAAAESTTFPVPLSRIALNVYKGTEAEANKLGASDLETGEPGKHVDLVTLTNTTCTSVTPNPDNETAASNVHTQDTTFGSQYGGHLEAPFQPFGAYQLCLYEEKAKKTYTVSGEDLTSAGSTQNIFLAQRSPTERTETKTAALNEEKATEEKRKNEETASREKREKEEAPAREAREKEEKTEETTRKGLESSLKTVESEEATQKKTRETEETAKASRLATEKSEREKWKTEEEKEEKKKKHLKPDLAEKEATQATARKTKEAEETKAEEKRKGEEATTKSTRTKDETGKETVKKEEEATAKKRESEEKAKTKALEKENEEKWTPRKKEEEATKAKREATETEETKEGTKITVESGKSGCPT